MPKVYMNDFDKKIYAFRLWFKGKRAMLNITLAELAREKGVSHASESNKLRTKGNNQTEITYRDLLLYFDKSEASDEEILRYMRLRGKK